MSTMRPRRRRRRCCTAVASSLGVIERRKFTSSTYLVESTEATILAEFAAYTSAVKTANAPKKQGDGGGEAEDAADSRK